MSINSLTKKYQQDKCKLAKPVSKIKTINVNSFIQLRDYQKQIVDRINYLFDCGKNSIMLVAPPGAGKNLIASHITRDSTENKSKVLIIVHREPLIDQTVFNLTKYGISASKIAYLKAGYPKPRGHELVIIASIQTLAQREYPANIDLIIFDETHTTSFYQESLNLIYDYAQAPIVALSKTKFRRC